MKKRVVAFSALAIIVLLVAVASMVIACPRARTVVRAKKIEKQKNVSDWGVREKSVQFGNGSAFDPRDAAAVIVMYRKDVDSWAQTLKKMGMVVHVIDKEKRLNLGHEALAYLEFIIENYDRLPTHLVLLHDEEYSWHHEGSLVDRLKDHVGKYVELETLNKYFWRPFPFTTGYPKEVEYGTKELAGIEEVFDTCLVNDSMRSLSLSDYGDFTRGMGCCAQFIVHRHIIYQRSLQAYKCMRDWIIQNAKDSKDKHPAVVLERAWNLVWERSYAGARAYENGVDAFDVPRCSSTTTAPDA